MDNLNQSSWARKHFKSLELLNTGIHELKENTLKGITFDEIHIDSCENLTTIHENAFIGTENVTKFIRISNNPELIYENSSIFNCLSKFINVKKMTIANNAKITEIPSNIFSKSISNDVLILISTALLYHQEHQHHHF